MERVSGFFTRIAAPLGAVLLFISIAVLVWWAVCIWGDIRSSPIVGQQIWWWIESHETIAFAFVTGFLLAATGMLAASQLVSMRRNRYAELLMHLDEQWESDSFINRRHMIDKKCHDIVQKLKEDHLDDAETQRRLKDELGEFMMTASDNAQKDVFVVASVLGFFETLAYLVRKNYIPLENVRHTFGPAMLNYYDLFENYIKELRKDPANKGAYKEMESVVHELT